MIETAEFGMMDIDVVNFITVLIVIVSVLLVCLPFHFWGREKIGAAMLFSLLFGIWFGTFFGMWLMAFLAIY